MHERDCIRPFQRCSDPPWRQAPAEVVLNPRIDGGQGDYRMALQDWTVLTRPEHLAESGATVAQIGSFLDALCAICRPVAISYSWRPTLRNADDEMVLEVAVNGRTADYFRDRARRAGVPGAIALLDSLGIDDPPRLGDLLTGTR